MRALIPYYVVQARAAERHRQAQGEAPARAAGRARRTGLLGPGGDHGPGTRHLRRPAGRPAGRELAENRARRLCRYLAGLGRCAGALPGYCGAVAAALASAWPDPPWWLYHRLHLPPRARAHPVVGGGMPGWQITLLVVAVTLLAAAIAVTVSRRRARPRTTATASPAHRQPGRQTPIPRSRQWKAG